MKKITISVVIPVYNEAAAIVPCLEALLAQTVKADEIIVVDNKSTDETRNILRPYAGKIRIITEPRAGVAFARTAGFDAAIGQVIGRIDADTHVAADWIAQLHGIFSDPNIDAVTGPTSYHDLPFVRVSKEIDFFIRRIGVNRYGYSTFLYGANMAIRARAWRLVRDEVCYDAKMHEDVDIALHLHAHRKKVLFVRELTAQVSLRRVDDNLWNFYRYMRMLPYTYEAHGDKSAWRAYSIAFSLFINYLPMRLFYRGYDPRRKRFSVKKMLLVKTRPRKNPMSSH